MKRKTIALIIVIAVIVISIFLLERSEVNNLNISKTPINLNSSNVSGEEKLYSPAVELVNPSGFINTGPFKIQDLIGKKVILIDFWDYSCINCERTIPYLENWYNKYKDQGLVVIGIHSPEFDFEKNYTNVLDATEKFNITYPVVLDNDFSTWAAYNNLYWPREALIDINGFIVYNDIGEGSYNETEAEIVSLLQQRGQVLNVSENLSNSSEPNVVSPNFSQVGSSETYFGSARNSFLANGYQGVSGEQNLTAPSQIAPNSLYLSGKWNFTDEYAENENSGAQIFYSYQAKNVYMVANAENVTLDTDVDGRNTSRILINGEGLYTLVSGSDYNKHVLEITVENPGLKAFTFTFG
jgi:thiol-disulfide isomerase/thioredoxin